VEFVLITPNNGLYFPAIDYLYKKIMHITKQDGYAKTPLVMNCAHLKGLDYTAAKGLSLISSEIRAKDQRFIVLNASEKMRYVCRKSGCGSMVFCNSMDALHAMILGEPMLYRTFRFLQRTNTNRRQLNPPIFYSHPYSDKVFTTPVLAYALLSQ